MREYRFQCAHFEGHSEPRRRELTERCLQRMLDCLTNINTDIERTVALPPFYRRGLTYEQEPQGVVEFWQDSIILNRTRRGDCEDLACAMAANLRKTGVDARARLQWIGGELYHVVVETPKGILDPSVELGMPVPPELKRWLSVQPRRR